MRLIVLLARALVIALLAFGCSYLVRALSGHGLALGPASHANSPVPSAMPSVPAPPPKATVLSSTSARAGTGAVTKAPSATLAAPEAAPAGLPARTVVPSPSRAPQAVGALTIGVPTPAVTALPAPAVSVDAPQTAPPPMLVAEAPVMAAPHDPPQILDVQISAQEIHGGDTVYGAVRTSSNVASVEARVEGYSSSLPKVGVGKFAIVYKVPPSIPFYLQHSYSLHLIARNIDGEQATRDLPVTLR